MEKADIKEYFSTKKITPAQLIIMLIGVLIFIFMETSLFKDLSDIAKILVYATIVILSVLCGVNVVDAKRIATEFRDILANDELSVAEKISGMTNLIIPILAEIGEKWDQLYGLQFKKKGELDD